MRVLVFGSCVSRDIIAAHGDGLRLELTDYYARCSLASLGARPMCVDGLERIASPFQRRMVERDLDKSFLIKLAKNEFDVLLLDLIDERFRIYIGSDGSACTLSNELLSTGFNPCPDRSNAPSISGPFWDMWTRGWRTLKERLEESRLSDRVRLNRVFWSSLTEDGANLLPRYSSTRIAEMNRILAAMYATIERDLSPEQSMQFSPSDLVAASEHKWGREPFHYTTSYYKAAAKQISGI